MKMVELKHQPYFLFLLVLAVGLFSCSVQSMRFDLQPGHARCFAENMKNYLMTFGNYSIVNPKENQTITVRVCLLIYTSAKMKYEQNVKCILY